MICLGKKKSLAQKTSGRYENNHGKVHGERSCPAPENSCGKSKIPADKNSTPI
jgi:hypothetical protein